MTHWLTDPLTHWLGAMLTIAKMTSEERGVVDDDGAGPGDDNNGDDNDAEERGAGGMAVNERLRNEVSSLVAAQLLDAWWQYDLVLAGIRPTVMTSIGWDTLMRVWKCAQLKGPFT